MSIHESIMKLLVSLGYTESLGGCCHGVSIKWLESCFLDEELSFHRRIVTIFSQGEVLIQLINAVKEKKGSDLTEQDKKLLDIVAFCDGLVLYQFPALHPFLFNASLSQLDEETISYYASSDAIQYRGGLTRIYSEPGIYRKNEIKAYLDELGVVIENASIKSKEILGVILTSHNHTIALTYKPGEGEWVFMDINQYPSIKFKIEDTNWLAQHIVDGFTASNVPYAACNVSVITSGNNLDLLNLKYKLEQFKKSHQLTSEIAHREVDEINLVFIAAKNGHAPFIAQLAKLQADLNKTNNEGTTPAMMAAGYGHASAIAVLAEHGADLNKASNDGRTPAILAAERNCASVIAVLAEHGADLNKATNDGITPTIQAADRNYASVIAVLAEHGADLNKATNDGTTPAYLAANQGHDSAIAMLAKYGADLNKATNDGMTPAIIAVVRGHASAIAALAKHGADLNKAVSGGITPAFMAVYFGKTFVVAELIKVIKVDGFNTPSYTASVNTLRQLVLTRGEKVIARMNAYIEQQLAVDPQRQIITMTPYNLAVVMENQGIIQMLDKKEDQVQKQPLNDSYQLKKPTKYSIDENILYGNCFFHSVHEAITNNGEKRQHELKNN